MVPRTDSLRCRRPRVGWRRSDKPVNGVTAGLPWTLTWPTSWRTTEMPKPLNETIQEALPVTTLLPETSAEPIVMFDAHAALRLALVERDSAHLIGMDWDQPGVYILLDLPDAEG